MNFFKDRVLFLRRFFYLLFFGKCAHSANDVTQISSSDRVHRARRCVTFLLSFVLLFVMVLPVSAADDSEETGVQIYDVTQMSPQMYWQTDDETVSSSYTSTMQMRTYSKGQNGVPVDMVGFSNTNPKYYNSGRQKMVVLTDYLTISPDTQYSLNFSHTLNFNAKYIIDVYVVAYGNGVKKIPIFSETYTGGNWSLPNYSDFSFKINSADLGTSYKCRLYIEHSILSQYGYGSDGTDVYQLIQREIEIVDDDVGWLVKILNAIRAIPTKIGGFFETLKQSISDWFADVGKWFEEQKQKIQDFSDSVGQWFDDLKLKIESTFQAAVDEIKSWFIPSDGYFDRKKDELETFAVDHFGAMYQGPDVMVDLIKKFTTMSPKQPSITLPAIQFDFQGTRYVLSKAVTYSFSWVNDKGHMLYYFYQFYRGFVTVILFIGFANYCIKKYNEVFGGGSE